LLHATGSAEHLDQLRTLAERKSMTLQADGLRKGRRLMAAKEEDIYEALGLQFIEPELREGRGEIERALKGELPELVTDRDLRGILHCHTDASDGTETLKMMANATRKRGFQYFGVADHSQSAHYAGGLSPEEIDAQHREANRLNKSFGRNSGSSRASSPISWPTAPSTTPTKFLVGSISSSRVFMVASSWKRKSRPPACSARSRTHAPRSWAI
jgi:DNA polymerase (family 10)